MNEIEKDYFRFVIECLLDLSEGVPLSDNDKCRLCEIISELEE